VIVIVETWLKQEDIQYFNFMNYESFHSVRRNKIGGGVAIFIHNSFDVANLVFEQDFNNNNTLVINLIKHKFKIIAFYRQPSNQSDPQGLVFIDNFEQILAKHSNAYVFGDFNFNLLMPNELIYKYQNAFLLNGYMLLNSLSEDYPTRINNNTHSKSIIDHVMTDTHLTRNTYKFHFHLFDLLADHKSILLNVCTLNSPGNKDSISPKLKIINHKKIIDSKIIENNTATDLDSLHIYLKQVIESNSKIISLKAKRNKPYITQEIAKLIKIRNNFFKLKHRFPYCNHLQQQYKAYRNKVARLIKSSKKDFLDRYFTDNADNPRKVWTQLKAQLYNRFNTHQTCELIVDNGIPITNKTNIATKFNNFFVSKTEELISTNTINDEDFHTFHSNEQYDIRNPCEFPICTEDEVAIIIDKLSNSKACDIYGLSNNFVKIHKKSLLTTLTTLINKSLEEGNFPDALKMGVVNPIHKSGSKTNIANYRPITILPIISKILEYVMLRRLEDHLLNNKIISNTQFGYTRNSNTEIAVLHILNDVYKGLDDKKATSLTCLDLSRAFDCVIHSILLNKLRKLKLPKKFLNLFASYLENRQQVVKLDNIFSSIRKVTYGLAQGGVLSGTLFNLYINSINLCELQSTIIMYCDDISLVTVDPNPMLLKHKLETDLSKISKWLKFHYLFPNVNKTHYLLFHNKRRHEDFYEQALNINFNGMIIQRVECTKLLGLQIDETLSFAQHIYELQNKIISFMFALKRIRPFINDNTAKKLYFAYIQSRLNYMNTVWIAAPAYRIDSLEIIQRKSLRIVLRKNWYCSGSELYSLQILPVKLMCQYSSAILTFKLIHSLTKLNFDIQYINEVHRYPTRNNEDILIPRTSTQLGSLNFFIRAFSQYNVLPNSVKTQISIGKFKNKLREHIHGGML
jgi:hypothetical protein